MPEFRHDDITFHYQDQSRGPVVVMQHGLGGDSQQPVGLLQSPAGVRVIAMDFRAHGGTRPVGPADRISIAGFARDVVVLMDHLGIERWIMGGISLGAAVALRMAIDFPQRLRGLILIRPAWFLGCNARNAELYGQIASLLRSHGGAEARRRLAESPMYRQMLAESPDCAASLLKQCEDPQIADRVVRLERLPMDQVCDSPAALRGISVPALVLGNRQDPIHPFDYAVQLADHLPQARMTEITAKSQSVQRYEQDVRDAVREFLKPFD